jgi:hypothetical protein
VDSDPIVQGVLQVTKRWTRQRKAEEKGTRTRATRSTLWLPARTSLKMICEELLPEAWAKASNNGELPTHWRQVFYVIRPQVDAHPDSDRPLTDERFKKILEEYLDWRRPGWDVLRGARGVFKEPHVRAGDRDTIAMSTAAVRSYLHAARDEPSLTVRTVGTRFPTAGARNRYGAVLICEKEGFDDLLRARRVPERFDVALMATKGISAIAARDLARGTGVPCFTLHDLDKNGFVMAAGFPFATDLGLRLDDVEEWGLEAEAQEHRNETATYENLRKNGATKEEATFIANGQRVELNMLTGPQFVEYVETKLAGRGVTKIVPDRETLRDAWRRAQLVARINNTIRDLEAADGGGPAMPDDLEEHVRDELASDSRQAWDDIVYQRAGGAVDDEDRDEDDEDDDIDEFEFPDEDY